MTAKIESYRTESDEWVLGADVYRNRERGGCIVNLYLFHVTVIVALGGAAR